jgi:hypothetical protein
MLIYPLLDTIIFTEHHIPLHVPTRLRSQQQMGHPHGCRITNARTTAEDDANKALDTITQHNAKLKASMPALKDWEVTDPTGVITNPHATEAQLA